MLVLSDSTGSSYSSSLNFKPNPFEDKCSPCPQSIDVSSIVHSTRRAGARRGAETFVKMEGGGGSTLAIVRSAGVTGSWPLFSLNNLAAEDAKEIELGLLLR